MRDVDVDGDLGVLMSSPFVSVTIESSLIDSLHAKARELQSPDGPIGRRLNGYAQATVNAARSMAREDLQEPHRPAPRRSKVTKGKVHYVDSLSVSTVRAGFGPGGGELVLLVTSTSPIAALLEKGAPPHEIVTPGFPKGRKGEPNFGTWNVDWEGGSFEASYEIWRNPVRQKSIHRRAIQDDRNIGDAHAHKHGALVVNHPGHEGYHFLQRAVERVLGQGIPFEITGAVKGGDLVSLGSRPRTSARPRR